MTSTGPSMPRNLRPGPLGCPAWGGLFAERRMASPPTASYLQGSTRTETTMSLADFHLIGCLDRHRDMLWGLFDWDSRDVWDTGSLSYCSHHHVRWGLTRSLSRDNTTHIYVQWYYLASVYKCVQCECYIKFSSYKMDQCSFQNTSYPIVSKCWNVLNDLNSSQSSMFVLGIQTWVSNISSCCTKTTCAN